MSVAAAPLLAPFWKRAKFWFGFAALVAASAVVVTLATGKPSKPLDPLSATKGGAKAIAVLLDSRGTDVTRTTSLSDALAPGSQTVLVAFPQAYSDSQLAALAASGRRLVLLAPDERAVAAFRPLQIGIPYPADSTEDPDCDHPAATTAGSVEFGPRFTYLGMADCYGGAVILTPDLVVLGSPGLLRNDHLAAPGVAGLALNAISDNGAVTNVLWLMPGPDAAGPADPTMWTLFPDGARRVFLWVLPLGLLVLVWRGRRLGPVVREPLPVVVRAAEVVEGHGRLYRKARALDRASAALRAAALHRLAVHFGLSRHPTLPAVTAATASAAQRPIASVQGVLAGPDPTDDVALQRLAADLDDLLLAAGCPPRSVPPRKGNT